MLHLAQYPLYSSSRSNAVLLEQILICLQCVVCLSDYLPFSMEIAEVYPGITMPLCGTN